MMKCHSCGVEKDMEALETSPHAEDDCLCDDPIPPLLGVDCEPDGVLAKWRTAKVCHECFHRLQPDMWIDERCWLGLNPVTRYADLPEKRGGTCH